MTNQELNKKFKETARLCNRFLDLEKQLNSFLCPSRSDDPEQDDPLREVERLRFDVAGRLRGALDGEADCVDRESKAQAKRAADELRAELEALPDLGLTLAEWSLLSDQDLNARRSVGRPPIPFEVKYLRAKSDFESSYHEYETLSFAMGCPTCSMDSHYVHPLPGGDMARVYNEYMKNMGKRGLDELGLIDSRIRDIDEKIEHIESGEAQREREQKEIERVRKGNKKSGRPPRDLDVVLREHREKREKLVDRLNRLESKLSPIGKIERAIKLKKDDIYFTRKKIRARGWDPKTGDRSVMPFGDALDKSEQDLSALKRERGELTRQGQATESDPDLETPPSRVQVFETIRAHRKSEENKVTLEDLEQLQREVDEISDDHQAGA